MRLSHDNLGCFPIFVVREITLSATSFDPLHALVRSLLSICPPTILNLDTLRRCWFARGSLRSKYLTRRAPPITVGHARQSARNIYDITATMTCQEALPEHKTAEICDILGHRMTNALLGLSFLGSHLRWVWLVLCSSSALISAVLAAVRIVVQKARCLGILKAQGSEGQQEWGLGSWGLQRAYLDVSSSSPAEAEARGAGTHGMWELGC